MDPSHGNSGQGNAVDADLVKLTMMKSSDAADGSVATTEAEESTLACSEVVCGSPLSAAAAPGLWETFLQLQREAHAYCEWAEVEADLAARLDGRPHALALLRSVYRLGVQQAPVLRALACLAGGGRDGNGGQCDDPSPSLRVVAAYFCLAGVTDTARLACLRLLVVLNSPLDAGWQVAEPALREALDFVLDAGEWEFLRHSELAYLDELRAMVRFLRTRAVEAEDDGTLTDPGVDGCHSHFPLRIQWATPNRKIADRSTLSTNPSRENLRQLELQLKIQLQESLNMSRSEDLNSDHDEAYLDSDGTQVVERKCAQATESYQDKSILTPLDKSTVSDPPSDADVGLTDKSNVSAQNHVKSDSFQAAAERITSDASDDKSNLDVPNSKAPTQTLVESLMQRERLAAVTTLVAKYVPSISIPGIFQQAAPRDSNSKQDVCAEQGDVWNMTLSKDVGQR